MIEDENHPAMVMAHQELLRRLGNVIGRGRPMTRQLMQEMRSVVDDHRNEYRGRGIAFPELVAVVVPRLGIIDWKRADLDKESIKTAIVNFVREHPDASMVEIVAAFRGAWPSLHPDDLMARGSDVRQKLESKAQDQ